jgi:hypothetical protein
MRYPVLARSAAAMIFAASSASAFVSRFIRLRRF